MSLRIGIYTIALNEAKFAARWAKTVKDADCALVADTGSTDDTVAILDSHGVATQRVSIRPWRFDDARNAALASLPDDTDVVISLDMDEVLVPDWRSKVESAWHGTRMRYGYIWSWINQAPDLSFLSEKITGRHTHRWKHPVHEILVPTVPEEWCTYSGVLVEHHADPEKSRGHYLDLLKVAVTEDPEDDRCSHYLARELFFYHDYQAAIAEFTRHLALPRAQWKAERASSMRYIAKCYDAMGDGRAYEWFVRGILEHSSRESLIEAARFTLAHNQFHATIDLCERALALGETVDTYMAERYPNNEGPYDLASVAYFHIGQRQKAISLASEAVRRNPDDQRLRDNLSMMGG